MTDAELELHIKACGRLVEKAMREGDKGAARIWLQAQNEGIACRSPAQVARMEACYFTEQGDADRVKLAEVKTAL